MVVTTATAIPGWIKLNTEKNTPRLGSVTPHWMPGALMRPQRTLANPSLRKPIFSLTNVNTALIRSSRFTFYCGVELDIEARFELATNYYGAFQDKAASTCKSASRLVRERWNLTAVLRQASLYEIDNVRLVTGSTAGPMSMSATSESVAGIPGVPCSLRG